MEPFWWGKKNYNFFHYTVLQKKCSLNRSFHFFITCFRTNITYSLQLGNQFALVSMFLERFDMGI